MMEGKVTSTLPICWLVSAEERYGSLSGPGVMDGEPGTHDEHNYRKFPNGRMPRFGKTVGCGKGGIIRDRGRMFVCVPTCQNLRTYPVT